MFLKRFMESSQEIPVLESILIKMQVSNQKETPSQKFFCEFSKSCKNTCFIEPLRAPVILTLLNYNFQFIVHFSPTFQQKLRIRGLEMLVFREILRTYLVDGPLLLKEFTKLSNLVSLEGDCQLEHHFILFLKKNKKLSWKKW